MYKSLSNKFVKFVTCLIHQTISLCNIYWIRKLAKLFQRKDQNAWLRWLLILLRNLSNEKEHMFSQTCAY